MILHLISITQFCGMTSSISNELWLLRTWVWTLHFLRRQKHMSWCLLFRQLSFINLSLSFFSLSLISLHSCILKLMISFMNILLDLLSMQGCFFHIHLSYCFFFSLTLLVVKFSFLFLLQLFTKSQCFLFTNFV